MIRTLLFLFLVFIPLHARAQTSQPALDKGSRIFLKRGLQIHALVFKDDPFHLQTLKDAHFTGVNFGWGPNMSWLGPAPGIPWNRWAKDETDFLTPPERPYVGNLVAFQLRDEQNMNDPKVRAPAVKWFNAARNRFRDTILYTNQYGGQVSNESMGTYAKACKPDMLSFDVYPLLEGPDNWVGFFGDLQRYRKLALGFGIPYAMWTQTFHGENKYRDPSESEMRLNTFCAWTFGYKMTTCFTYNAGSTNLFKGPGDQNPTDAYRWIAKINAESLKLSPALVRLKSADVRILLGQRLENGKPADNPRPIDIEPWQYNVNDPYLRGVVVKNLGQLNNGLKGDIYIGWFKPLPTEGKPDEIYFMVLNALCDRSASAAAARQKITLNFHFKDSGITGIQRLSRESGKVEAAELRHVGSEPRYLLDLELDGGSADLFKFKTEAPFVGSH